MSHPTPQDAENTLQTMEQVTPQAAAAANPGVVEVTPQAILEPTAHAEVQGDSGPTVENLPEASIAAAPQAVSETTRAISETTRTVSETIQAVPKTTQSVPETTQAVSHSTLQTSSAVPEESRAWFIASPGEPPKLELRSRPTPKVKTGGGNVLVKVAYAGLNPATDLMMALPLMSGRIPELDFSGVVVGTGERVAGSIPVNSWLAGTGALAEYISVPRSALAELPAGVPLADGATTIPVVTAQALVREARLSPGNKVVVNAASGSVGGLVVQLARRAVGDKGVVIGVCSASKSDNPMKLGANETIDYTAGDVVQQLAKHPGAPFDAVIDALGIASLWSCSASYLRKGGHFATVGLRPASYGLVDISTTSVHNLFYRASPRYHHVRLNARPERIIREGAAALPGLTITRDSIWKFEEAPQAFAKLLTGHAGGKILVKVDPTVGDDE